VLPQLFAASLPITFVAAPAASAFLGRRGVSRGHAVHQLYGILALSFVGTQMQREGHAFRDFRGLHGSDAVLMRLGRLPGEARPDTCKKHTFV